MVFESRARTEQTERFMGRPVSLDFREPLPATTRHALGRQVFDWLRTVDALFDAHDGDSQVGLLDQGLLRHGLADPLVHAVLNDCARLNRRTEGYFDIFAGEHLDLSGYVKGWALQRASALLTEAGAPGHRIRAGGDAYAAGRPAPGRTWRIAVPDPFRPNTTAWRVPATDLGVATTDGHARVDHIRDPWTRRPASGLASVTVAGPDLGTAAGYAIAAYAMGPDARDWLAELDDAYTYAFIDEAGRRFHGWVPGLVLAA